LKLPHRRQFLHLAAGGAALPAVSRFAWAQTYPSRPVRIIVGVAAGGTLDILTLYEKLNFTFIGDIAPLAGIIRAANVMVVNPSVPARTVPELSPTPRPTPASSTCRRAATEPRNMSPANCSK
jgi:tripartite-type tricarboxylate transporter receptor subunit TctC